VDRYEEYLENGERDPQWMARFRELVYSIQVDKAEETMEEVFVSAADEVGLPQEYGDKLIHAVYKVLRYHKIPIEVLSQMGINIYSNMTESNSLSYVLVIKFGSTTGAEFRRDVEFPMTDKQFRDIAEDLTVWLKLVIPTK